MRSKSSEAVTEEVEGYALLSSGYALLALPEVEPRISASSCRYRTQGMTRLRDLCLGGCGEETSAAAPSFGLATENMGDSCRRLPSRWRNRPLAFLSCALHCQLKACSKRGCSGVKRVSTRLDEFLLANTSERVPSSPLRERDVGMRLDGLRGVFTIRLSRNPCAFGSCHRF